MDPVSAELARLERDANWNPDGAMPIVAPGSDEEARVLSRIDELREQDQERQADTFAARRKRQRRYWKRETGGLLG